MLFDSFFEIISLADVKSVRRGSEDIDCIFH